MIQSVDHLMQVHAQLHLFLQINQHIFMPQLCASTVQLERKLQLLTSFSKFACKPLSLQKILGRLITSLTFSFETTTMLKKQKEKPFLT